MYVSLSLFTSAWAKGTSCKNVRQYSASFSVSHTCEFVFMTQTVSSLPTARATVILSKHV